MLSLPRQKLSFKDKTEAWKKECVDAIISMSYNNSLTRRTQDEKKENYDIVNGIINEESNLYVTDPLNLKGQYGGQPAKLRCYPLIQSKLNKLLGEELKRKFKYRVICTQGDGVTQKNKKKEQSLKQHFEQKLYAELGITEEQTQAEDFQKPEDIVKFFDYEYEDIGEIYSNRILKQLEHRQELKYKFNKGLKHGLITAEEIYNCVVYNDEPYLRVVEPLFLWYLKSDNSEWIEDSYMILETRNLTKAEIIDEYREFLTDDEIDKIESITFSNSFHNSYKDNNDFLLSNASNNILNTHGVLVYNVCWKSFQKINYIKYFDKYGKPQQDIVLDENFKLTDEEKQQGATLESQWIIQCWEGTKIGTDIYINIKPCNVQIDGKLPYIGTIYNNLNSQATSIVDLLKPHQHTYNIIWYKLNLELSKAQGKKLLADTSLIPKHMSLEQWMNYMQTFNIIFVNTKEEGSEMSGGTLNNTNPFKDIDMSASNTVSVYMNYLNKLEQMMDDIIGMNPQRKGEISPYETSSGISQAVDMSYTITESLFYQHDLVKRNVLTYLVQLSKFCYNTKSKSQFINSDFIKESFEIDTDLMKLSDYGVFLANNTEDEIIFNLIRQNAQVALQRQNLEFVDFIKLFKSNSVTEGIKILERGQEKAQQLKQQEFQNQQSLQTQQQEFETNKDFKNKQFDLLKQKNEIDNKIRLKEMDIQSEFGLADGLYNNTPNPESIIGENEKANSLRIKSNIDQMKAINEIKKSETDNNNKLTELSLKDKALQIKEKDIEAKQQIAKENKNKYDVKK